LSYPGRAQEFDFGMSRGRVFHRIQHGHAVGYDEVGLHFQQPLHSLVVLPGIGDDVDQLDAQLFLGLGQAEHGHVVVGLVPQAALGGEKADHGLRQGASG